MAFQIKDLMQKVVQPVEFACGHSQEVTDTQAPGPCCHKPCDNSQIITDTQKNHPCCGMPPPETKGECEKEGSHKLAGLASLRAELRRVLPQPPA